MILLPRAFGTVKAPPLMSVPGAAVVRVEMWQMSHPIEWKSEAPAWALAVAAKTVSREGALVARMKRANASMSPSGSSPQFCDGLAVHGWLSGTASHRVVNSCRLSRLVIPISFRYAPEANVNRLAS